MSVDPFPQIVRIGSIDGKVFGLDSVGRAWRARFVETHDMDYISWSAVSQEFITADGYTAWLSGS